MPTLAQLDDPFCYVCGKPSYPSERAATRALRAFASKANPKARRSPPRRVYACPSGNGWHLTARRDRRPRGRMAR